MSPFIDNNMFVKLTMNNPRAGPRVLSALGLIKKMCPKFFSSNNHMRKSKPYKVLLIITQEHNGSKTASI